MTPPPILLRAPAERRGVLARWVAVACLALPAFAAPAREPALREDVSAALTRLQSRQEATAADLARFYGERGFEPAWFANGRPTAQAGEAVALLRTAVSHGLEPADYDAEGLAQRLRDAYRETIAATDTALTSGLFAFLRNLGRGRIVPPRLRFEPARRMDEPDLARVVAEATTAGRLPGLAARLAPASAQYERLRGALARYRVLASEPLAALPAVRKLAPGQDYAGIAALHRLLVALGDLAPGTGVPQRYEGEIVAAVRRFQERHGLDADGVIGKASLAALNAPLRGRVRQIELALERLRWLPPLTADKLIVVNVPEFRLRAMRRDGETFSTALRMNVIVGRALDTQTPMLIEELRRIEFRPYWNIPPSIARKEVVPRLRREPEYLAREAMEFVPTRGGRPTTEPSEAMLEAVLRGEARIRQRPGPRNALGAIKFVFPNNANIYLHHTPGTALFARGRRDFSHGCIRVEAPVELARFVLEEETGWDEARILAAMREDASPRTLRVRTPIPVLVFYTTAVAEEDGRMFFLPDLYGHDAALDAALRQRP